MTPTIPSRVLVLAAAGDSSIVPATGFPIGIQILNGSTVRVETTLAPGANIDDDSAEWLPWAAGDKPGPYAETITDKVTALRVTAVGAAATVYIS